MLRVHCGFGALLLISATWIAGCNTSVTTGELDGDDSAATETATKEPPGDKVGTLERFVVNDAPPDPAEPTVERIVAEMSQANRWRPVAPSAAPPEKDKTANEEPSAAGGLGFNIKASGLAPVLKGGGAEAGKGTGTGRGGPVTGFGGRGQGSREAMVGRFSGVKQSERAIAAALLWLARHQSPLGNWSLDGFHKQCSDSACAALGNVHEREDDVAATALSLLTFLGWAQTPTSKGPHQANVSRGVRWLVRQQEDDGSFRGANTAYTHAWATLALCETHATLDDKEIAATAQKAVDFLVRTQDKTSGGWRVAPGMPENTLVYAWHIEALKSAAMHGLDVPPECFDNARKFLDSVAVGECGGRFWDERGGAEESMAATAAGLRCRLLLGAKRTDDGLIAGTDALMRDLPNLRAAGNWDVHYVYFAKESLRCMMGPQWDAWNREVRRALVDSQCRTDCAAGSWTPAPPEKHSAAVPGGRLVATCFSTMTLEVWTHSMPPYQRDRPRL